MTRAGWAVAAIAAAAIAVPAGMAAAGGRGSPPRPDDRVATVVLTAHHSRFTPSTVTVAAGTTVRLVVRNLDPIDHELIVGGPEVHRHHAVGRDAHHHGDVPGEVSVPAGRSASTSWPAPGTGTGDADEVTFACHLPGHLDYGMAGTIRVTTRT